MREPEFGCSAHLQVGVMTLFGGTDADLEVGATNGGR